MSSALAQTTKVLYLGNSYTAGNNLPDLVYQVALSQGDTMSYASNTPGGHTLEGHSMNPTSLAAINSDDWDFVVMQEQSQRPSFPPSQVAVEVFPFAANLVDTIKANNPCTEPVFFMTWGRKYGDQQNCPNWPWVCTFDSMQYRLRDSYIQMGYDNDATIAPVGISWQVSWTDNPAIDLWTADNSHPNIYGSYLAACTFYATFYGKSPSGSWYPSGITQQEATWLQDVATMTVLDSLDHWRVGHQYPDADFTHLASQLNVAFTDNSSNATSWAWDFGDGNTSTMQHPIHVYQTGGTYTVQLIASNACFTDTFTMNIDVIGTGLDDPMAEQILISPNPVQSELNIQMGTTQEWEQLTIFDTNGRLAHKSNDKALFSSGNQATVDISFLKSGVYILQLETAQKATRQRFTKK